MGSVCNSANLSCLRFAFASFVVTNISYILCVYPIAEYGKLEKQERESRRVHLNHNEYVSVGAVPLFPHPDKLSASVFGFGVFEGYNNTLLDPDTAGG